MQIAELPVSLRFSISSSIHARRLPSGEIATRSKGRPRRVVQSAMRVRGLLCKAD
jgi:hypothetical protein